MRAEPGDEAQICGTGEGRPVKQEEHGAMNGALKQTEVTLTTGGVGKSFLPQASVS